MTYYILPSNKLKLQIRPCIATSDPVHISHSVNYYNNLILGQIKKLDQYAHHSKPPNFFNQVAQFVNPYQFIFSKIPNYKCSISKLHSNSNSLYELIELSYVCNLFESFKYKTQINIYHIGDTSETTGLLQIFRNTEYSLDNVYSENNINNIIDKLLSDNEVNIELSNALNYDLLFFNLEYNNNVDSFADYCKNIIKILFVILSIQNANGISIIKVEQLHHKLLIDFIYILNSYFSNVCIIKPNCASIIENTHYIVCKYFTNDCKNHEQNVNTLRILFTCADYPQIYSLLDIETPCFFLNKIEEFNIIIGQQQLDGYFQIINILKNKNKEEKFETLKRNNIIKCIQWCEKYHVPYNKIIEKNNMFNGQKTPKNIFNSKQHCEESDEEDVCENSDLICMESNY
jgi:hypothetical protein